MDGYRKRSACSLLIGGAPMPRHTPDDDLNLNLLVCILLVFVSVFALVFVFYRPVSHHTPDDNF